MRSRRSWSCFAVLVLGATTPPPLFAQEGGASSRFADARQIQYLPLSAVRAGTVRMPAALARRVSIRRSSALLQQVLVDVASQAGLGLAYDQAVARSNTMVSVDFENATAADALAAAVHGTRWAVMVTAAGQVTVVRAEAQLQTGVIVGQVTDSATGQPVAGAGVLVVGTQLGANTNAAGRFTINAVPPGQHTVRATRIGFAPQLQTVLVTDNGSVTVDFRLTPVATQLDAVVSVGYGRQERVNVTGAVASVRGGDIAERPVPNVSQALQGMVPGLTVINRGGAPGRDQADVKIRGVGTLNNANPLILIDGIPGDLNTIPPNDVQDISVLKDASSAAIYGSRAANGVILVTTRRGGPSKKLSVAYDSYVGVQHYERMPELIDPGSYLRIVNEAYVNAGRPARFSEEYIQNTIAGTDPLKYPRTNWITTLYSAAPTQEHTLRVSGGTDLARFSLSGNLMNQRGMLPNTAADRRGLRLNTDFNVSKRLTGGVDLWVQQRADREPSDIGNTLWRIWHDNDGPATVAKYPNGMYGFSANNQNALAAAEVSGRHTRQYTTGVLSGQADYTLLDGLTLRTNASVNYGNLFDRNFRNAETFYDYWDSTRVVNSWGPNALNELTSRSTEVNLRGLADYSRSFGRHGLHVLLGYEQTENDYRELGASRQRFVDNQLQEINVGDASSDNNSGRSAAWRLQSGFGRLNYTFQNRYLLEANGRYDGSSRFAARNRFGFFPSFSAGWRLSEEPFMRGVRFVDNLKLRGSWGRLGNQDIRTLSGTVLLYPYYSTLDLGQNYGFGNTLVPGAAQLQAANQNISWETTTMTNGGLDADFFDRRLSVTADVFRRTTDGILLTLPLPSVIGLAPPPQNAGVVRNTGWETGLAWQSTIGGARYSLGLDFSDVRNTVVDLAGTGPYINNIFVTAEGRPLGSLFGYQAVGLFQSQDEVSQWARQHPLTGPGDIKYKDQNGDGVIDTRDKVVMGSTLPRYTVGGNIGVSVKGFDVSAFLQGALKVDSYIEGALAEGPNWEGLMTTAWRDHWTPDNRDATMPRALLRSTHNGEVSTFWLRDARYLKLKTMQVGYTVPQRLASQLNAERVRLYISGTNLLTFSNEDLLDPEFPAGRGAVYPPTRTIAVGANVGF